MLFALFLIFHSIDRVKDDNKNINITQTPKPKGKNGSYIKQTTENKTYELTVQSNMSKKVITNTTLQKNLLTGNKPKTLTTDNFFQEVSTMFAPGKIVSSYLLKFNEWNEDLNYKTRYKDYYGVDMRVNLPHQNGDYVKEGSYNFYKLLYSSQKKFRIAQVFLTFEVVGKPALSAQVTLGERAINRYFSKGEGSPDDFYSWVMKNKTPETEEFAEDVIWVNWGNESSWNSEKEGVSEEDALRKAQESFKQWALKTDVTEVHFESKNLIWVRLKSYKYTTEDNVKQIAAYLARAYVNQTGITNAIVTVWNGDEVYAKGYSWK